jgi:predicted nucleic acid-binding protein
MITYLPDTNILINALNNKRGHRELLMTLLGQGDRLACCGAIVAELFSGIKQDDLMKIEEFLSLLVWYPTTRAIARRAGRWRFDWARQGITLSLADTLIAATAAENGLKLITNNHRHFPMPELSMHVCE